MDPLDFVIIFSVAVVLMIAAWFPRDSFSLDSYEERRVDGYYWEQFATIDDLPENVDDQ